MKIIVLIVALTLILATVGYGQLYEPEHLWHLCGEEAGDWFGMYPERVSQSSPGQRPG